MPSFVVYRGQCNRPAVSKGVGRCACLATMVSMKKGEDFTAFLVYCARAWLHGALVIEKTKAYKRVYCQFGNPSDTLLRDISKTDGALTFIATSNGKNTRHLVGLGDANFANTTD